MLSSDEHSGLFAFMFGLIVVVFAGIALSLAVDRRFSFSSSVTAIEAEVRSNESDLENLKEIHRQHSWSLAEREPKRKMADATLADLQRRAADLATRRQTLLSERESLKKSIPVLKEEFARYRRKYIEAARHAATGEFLGTLAIPGGRTYSEASISRVTEIGLEIRHAHGSARISAMDLDAALQDRFQWDDEERLAGLAEERETSSAHERMTANASHPQTPRPSSDAPPDPQKILTLRSKVIAWRTKVAQLQIERGRALSSAYGSQASPPGSLETWQARATRLGMEVTKAEAGLAAAKTALALVSPDDELLKSKAVGR